MRIHHSLTGKSKAAMFKMRPRMGFIWLAVFIGLFGGWYSSELHSQSLYDPMLEPKARLVLWVTVILTFFSLVISTARMWYAHLWHRRK